MTVDKYTFTYVTLFGKISISEDGEGRISGLYLPCCNLPCTVDHETETIAEAAGQLKEYLSGNRKKFDLPLVYEGSDFQNSVWSRILEIPYGKTMTYGQIAKDIGSPGASRAVGTACGRNPIPIFIPCHRVVPSSGGIGSYIGGKTMKNKLLKLENEFI
ncbi:MAG: methylated-DNA-[protein]-cysteine S-methyltransferase [Candidatus Methanomethylophilaceae archaeon]|nr:methylated-DNA-[protein]-cysteine S-methyltransferase [Candidatus Methanomethylophilaceae archaeon]